MILSCPDAIACPACSSMIHHIDCTVCLIALHCLLFDDTTQLDCEMANPKAHPEAIYCEDCEMWLNGPTQWEDHKIGKMHKRKARRSEPLPKKSDDDGCDIASLAPKVVITKGQNAYRHSTTGDEITLPEGCKSDEAVCIWIAQQNDIAVRQVLIIDDLGRIVFRGS